MKKSLAVLVAVLAFTVLSTHSSFADAALDAAALRMVVIVEKVGSIANDQKTNCDEMATQLSAYADSTATERAQLNTVLGAATPADRKALETKYSARIRAAQQNIAAGMQACSSNARVVAAMGKLGNLPK